MSFCSYFLFVSFLRCCITFYSYSALLKQLSVLFYFVLNKGGMFQSLLTLLLIYDKGSISSICRHIFISCCFILFSLMGPYFFVCLVKITTYCTPDIVLRNLVCNDNWKSRMMGILLQRGLLLVTYLEAPAVWDHLNL